MQIRYMVQWNHTYMLEQHIATCMENGYKPHTIQEVTDADHNLVAYTLKALGYCEDPNLKQNLKKVTWEATWEPEASMNKDPLKQLLADYKQRQQKTPQNKQFAPPTRNQQLNTTQQQGQWQAAPNQDYSNMDRHVTHNLILSTDTIKPRPRHTTYRKMQDTTRLIRRYRLEHPRTTRSGTCLRHRRQTCRRHQLPKAHGPVQKLHTHSKDTSRATQTRQQL